uniref:Uncharacterized protein n=1 Tax=Romanomermis culicivorax TaxID=13658 RepID=A0A915IDG2_ROMCU
MNLNSYQLPYASHGASIDPYSGSAASSLGPDYSYASAPSAYGMVPPPGGHQISQHSSFEYGSGQKLTPPSLLSHSPAASAYYDVGHGRGAGALTSNTSSKV